MVENLHHTVDQANKGACWLREVCSRPPEHLRLMSSLDGCMRGSLPRCQIYAAGSWDLLAHDVQCIGACAMGMFLQGIAAGKQRAAAPEGKTEHLTCTIITLHAALQDAAERMPTPERTNIGWEGLASEVKRAEIILVLEHQGVCLKYDSQKDCYKMFSSSLRTFHGPKACKMKPSSGLFRLHE